MKTLYKIILLYILFSCSPLLWRGAGGEAFAQNRTIDSVQTLIKTDKADTNKVKHLTQLSLYYKNLGIYDTAIIYCNTSLRLAKELNFRKGLSFNYVTMGLIYYHQGNYPEALENQIKGLKIKEEERDKTGMAISYNNIGLIYHAQENYTEALKYYLASLKLAEEQKMRALVSHSYNNIGLIYYAQNHYEEALKNYFIALKMDKETEDKSGISNVYSNIGVVYGDQRKYSDALKYYLDALKIKDEIGDEYGKTACLINAGNIYTQLNKLKESEHYLNNALDLSNKIGSKASIRESYESLAVLDSAQGNWKAAYEHHKLFKLYADSIDNDETKKKIMQAQMNYDFDKKEAVLKAEQDKKTALYEKQKQLDEYKKYALIGLIFFVGLLALLLLNRQRIKTGKKEEVHRLEQQLIQTKLKSKELETRQLQSDLDHNREKLTSYTNLIIEKTRMMNEMEERLEKIKNLSTASSESTAEQLLATIKENVNPGEYWEEFIVNFNLVYKDFFDQLTKTAPDLTRNQMKLCALIKCKLGHKEIANVLNISPDSVKMARNRLKKKLNLEENESLTAFLLSLE